jgi:hypothetical protein
MSAQMNIVQIEKFEILPSNQPANNTYSFRNGNPIITFNIGSQNKLLKASTVRINGKLNVLSAAGAKVNNNGLDGTAAVAVDLNSRIGVNGIFQNVNIASNDTNQTLESIRQYGRMVATVLPSTHSSEDYLSNNSVVEVSPGLDALGGNYVNNEINFSMRLFTGMMNGGNAIPMGVNGVRGLTINLELVSDQQFLKGANANDAGGAFYQVKDLSLTGDMLIPDAQGQQRLTVPGNGSFSYNSYNNLYSVIDANDATQTYNIANSNVLNIFHNFLPVSHANNYAQDGFSTNLPQLTDAAGANYNGGDVIINKVSFSRGGMKLGLDYDLDVQEQSVNGAPQTGLEINALNSIKPFYNLTHLLNQPLTHGFGGNDQLIYETEGLQSFSSVDANRNFAIGLALDNVSQVGVDFRGQSYATRIQSNLDGKSPNAVYTYVLSKNTLMYSPQGIMVQS